MASMSSSLFVLAAVLAVLSLVEARPKHFENDAQIDDGPQENFDDEEYFDTEDGYPVYPAYRLHRRGFLHSGRLGKRGFLISSRLGKRGFLHSGRLGK